MLFCCPAPLLISCYGVCWLFGIWAYVVIRLGPCLVLVVVFGWVYAFGRGGLLASFRLGWVGVAGAVGGIVDLPTFDMGEALMRTHAWPRYTVSLRIRRGVKSWLDVVVASCLTSVLEEIYALRYCSCVVHVLPGEPFLCMNTFLAWGWARLTRLLHPPLGRRPCCRPTTARVRGSPEPPHDDTSGVPAPAHSRHCNRWFH